MKKFVAGMSLAALMLAGTMAFAAGADDYKAKCAMCHGADGKGAMAKKMGSHDLTDPRSKRRAKPTSQRSSPTVKGKMTGFKGKLSDDQIKAVAGLREDIEIDRTFAYGIGRLRPPFFVGSHFHSVRGRFALRASGDLYSLRKISPRSG